MKNLFTIIPVAILFIFLSSCGGNDVDCTGTSFSQELSSEINAFTAAATAYSLDPNSSNCNAYKDALRNYFDAFEPYKDCGENAQQKAEIEADLDEIRDEIDQISC